MNDDAEKTLAIIIYVVLVTTAGLWAVNKLNKIMKG